MPKVGKSFVNTNFHSLFNNSDSDYFDYTMANIQDAFFKTSMNTATEGKFRAIVLSGLFSPGENTGFSHEWTDARKVVRTDGQFFQCIVRPLGVTDGVILPDPCAPNLDIQTRRKLIEMPPWATSEWSIEATGQEFPQLYPGQVITCYYETGTIGDSTYSELKFENPTIGGSSSPINGLCLAAFQIDASAFTGEDYQGIFSGTNAPTLNDIGSDMGDYESDIGASDLTGTDDEHKNNEVWPLYDSDSTIKNKAQHAQYFATMHPTFVKFCKAIIYDIHKVLGGWVNINSGFRTIAEQDAMRAKWDKWNAEGRVGPKPYVVRPVAGGDSKHNYATAMDFNVWIGSKMYRGATSKEEWINSGVPTIIEHYGMQWGGHFKSGYDPIHLHMEIKKSSKDAIKAATGDIVSRTEAIEKIKDIALEWKATGY